MSRRKIHPYHVNETWYKDLKDSVSFYNAVTAADLIDHLNKIAGASTQSTLSTC